MRLVEDTPAAVEAIHHAMTFAIEIEIEIATEIVTETFAMDHPSDEMNATEIGLVATA
jgi:hypothetical protein